MIYIIAGTSYRLSGDGGFWDLAARKLDQTLYRVPIDLELVYGSIIEDNLDFWVSLAAQGIFKDEG